MKRPVLIMVILSANILLAQESGFADHNSTIVVPSIMALSGLGLATVWTLDILKGDKLDMGQGFFKVRDPDSSELMWPHFIAEYSTAAGLLLGAYGLHQGEAWGRDVALVSLGALAYTSLNSQSWSLAKKERLAYAIPMMVSLAGAGISIVILL